MIKNKLFKLWNEQDLRAEKFAAEKTETKNPVVNKGEPNKSADGKPTKKMPKVPARKIALWAIFCIFLGFVVYLIVDANTPKTSPLFSSEISKIEIKKDEDGEAEFIFTDSSEKPITKDFTIEELRRSVAYTSSGLSAIGYTLEIDFGGGVYIPLKYQIVGDNITMYMGETFLKYNVNDATYTTENIWVNGVDTASPEWTAEDKSELALFYKTFNELALDPRYRDPGFDWAGLFISLLPIFLYIGLFYFIYRMYMRNNQGGDSVFSFGKSQDKLAESTVKFTDVAGIEEEKLELSEIVDYLKGPQKYAAMGARTPRGVMLYGPPGTGKTLLAKAVAGEAGVPFFQVSGSSFEDMLVGSGARRVRDLFNKARKASPSIIFIDEIDSVASKRGSNTIVGGGGGIADQTINQLLAEMDGFNTETGVVIIAATNRLDVLDEALLRPGRFDRQVQVTLPDIKERTAILEIHARNKPISSRVNLEEIARRTPGFSGAQLENVLNEATLLAVRRGGTSVKLSDIDEAIDRTIAGPAKTTRIITPEEKNQIAYHEAGHALIGLHSDNGEVVQKITIIPRGNAAGYTLQTPRDQELAIKRKSDLLEAIRVTLGGRVAEEIVFGEENISTGASNDFYKVTNIVRAMVMQLGMTKVGKTQFVPSEGTVNPYQQRLYSESTAQAIDKEIERIIEEQYQESVKIVKENRKELDLIVETLLILETIVKEQIDYIHTNLALPPEAIAQKEKLAKQEKDKKDKEPEVTTTEALDDMAK